MDHNFETYLEIDLSSITHNYNLIKSHLKPNTKIMAVVKSNAYGSDVEQVSLRLQDIGINCFAVAYAEEAVALRNFGITKPILVFYPQNKDFDDLIKFNIIPSVYGFEFLSFIHYKIKSAGIKSFPIHLNINSGMNRLGFDFKDFPEVESYLKLNKALSLTGMFSHFSAAGMQEEKAFSYQQIDKLKAALAFFEEYKAEGFISHLSNSSGLINFLEADMDMIRIGIALYGYGKESSSSQLTPMSTLKTKILQMRWLEVGESVGYDRKFKAEKKTKVATIPLGYADGISRIFGNYNAKVKINGHLVPIIGNVCMDTIMLDVTDVDCNVRDEVIIFGKTHPITEFDFKKLSIPYEMMCRIPKRIPRVFV
jgi:alanine racemase